MKIPPSLSLIRGLSSTGIGEGDHSISHGEQYLFVDPALHAGDHALFAKARPWLTLDTDPLDRNTLGERLIAWSVFNRKGRIFVVHLGPAENYDKRSAYFSHALAWAWEECATPFDPLRYFGFSEGFERPWRFPAKHQEVDPDPPNELDIARIRENPDLAIKLLAACWNAVTKQRPLIIAAPVEKLARGGALESLARFALAALPRTDKKRIALRFYTRRPEQLVEQSGANIVFAPEATVAPLLRNPNLTVTDGSLRIISGEPPDDLARRYAEGVYRNLLRLPDSLIAFTNHFAQVELNDEEKVRLLPVIYNLADALGAGDKERQSFLTRFLPDAPQRIGLPLFLRSLANPKRWSGFPPNALIEILLPSSTGDAKADSLAMELSRALDGSGWSLDTTVRAWWDPGSDDKLNRLLLLTGNTQSLLSESVLLDLLKDVPLTRIPSAEYVCWLLAAEDRAGALRHRSAETDPLIQLAKEDGNTRQLLFEATAARRLGADWIRGIIEDPRQEQELFQALFENVFADIREIQRWGGIPERFAFAAWRSGIVSTGMAEQAQVIAGQCDAMTAFPLLLELASLWTVAREIAVRGASHENTYPINPITERLFRAVTETENSWRKRGAMLVDTALDPERPGISPELFVAETEAGGRPIDQVLGIDTLPKLLAAPEFRTALGYPALLELAGYAPDSRSMERIMEEIDRFLLEVSPDSKVRDKRLLQLLRSGLWGYWRERFTPRENLNALRLVEYWFRLNAEPDRKSGIPMEEWQATLKGLILDSSILGRIWPSAQNRFPWIVPFERRQVANLAGCAADLKTLGLLRQRLLESGGIDISPAELEGILDANCRSPNKITEIAEALHSDPNKIIPVIAKKELWDWGRIAKAIIFVLDDLVSAVRNGRQFSHDGVFLITLNENADRILLPSDAKRFYQLAYRLGELGYSRLADRLSSNITIDVELDRSTEELTAYLLGGDAPPMMEIALEFENALGRWEQQQGINTREFDSHPLVGLASQVKEQLRQPGRKQIGSREIWNRLAKAVKNRPNLIKPMLYPKPWLPLFEVAALFSIDEYLSGLAKGMVVSCDIKAQSDDWPQAVYYSMERLANGERADDYMPREASEYDVAFAEFKAWLQEDMGWGGS